MPLRMSGICFSVLVAAAVHLPSQKVDASESAWPFEVSALAWVDTDSITTIDLAELLSRQKRPTGDSDVTHLSSEGVLQRLIQNRLLEQEGYRTGIQDSPEIRNQIWELVRHRAMMALLDSVAAEAAEEPEELGPSLDRTSTMYRVSHILVDDEAFARALLDSLAAGASFAELARSHSRDTARADADGYLGWARSDLHIPPFQEALQGLSKGEFAGPVKTEQGWHVLELTDSRTETAGQSDKMREQLQEAAKRERVMQSVRSYVESLKEEYRVVTADSLLATLDYASADPAVKAHLKESEAVLATFPWRTLAVRDLTHRIRFEFYHGIEGRPDADQIRDRVFDEWVTELLLRHEAAALGYDKSPEIVAAADRLERELVREAVVNQILDFPFDPSPEEIAAHYAAHLDELTRPARVRAEGVHFADGESARAFRDKVEAGARVSWLAGRAPGVQDPSPSIYSDWIDVGALGLSENEVEVNMVVGPFESEGIWVVAKIVEVEPVTPTPLEECRNTVVAMMKRDRMQEKMARAIATLESQATIIVAESAHATIATWIDDWLGKPTTSSSP